MNSVASTANKLTGPLSSTATAVRQCGSANGRKPVGRETWIREFGVVCE